MTVAGPPTQLANRQMMDAKCITAAFVAGIRGTYVALVNYGPGKAPIDYVVLNQHRSIVLPTGAMVATDDTFFTDNHLHAIDRDAEGKALNVDGVWTGFTAAGKASNHDCLQWTSVLMRDDATMGSPYKRDIQWAQSTVASCDGAGQGVYCIEQ